MATSKLEKIKNNINGVKEESGGFLSFTNDTRDKVLAKYSPEYESVVKEKVAGYEFVTDINIRTPFTRADYEHFRPNEAIPRKFSDMVRACRTTYSRVGVIRNIIDMMTDFAVEDFKLVHPDKKIEAFSRVWAAKVKMNEAVEEFVRHLLVDGNVVVKRITANLTEPVKTQMKEKVKSDADIKILVEKKDTTKKEIPFKYMFLNVIALQWVGGDLAKMAGKRVLSFTLSPTAMGSSGKQTDAENKVIMDNLPADIREALQGKRGNTIPLDMSKIYMAYNKKDSWDDWASPFLVSVLSDVYFRDKLRLAETAALDGWINTIRIWKLGDHKEGILPDDAAIAKLINILNANTGGGTMDLVWDSMLTVEEHYPDLTKVLGSEKYEQVNRDILIGLGVPEVLIGGQGGNFSNSWIQLKTLVERLKFIRTKIREWLSVELEMLSDAMEWPKPPIPSFNEANLQDENISKKLILGLLDRNVISVEAVLNAYGEDFMVELERIKQQKDMLEEAGVEVLTPIGKGAFGEEGEGQNAPSPGGRPSQTQDVSRKDRTPKPRTKGGVEQLTLYALAAIESIDKHIIPLYIKEMGVDDLRKLTDKQKDEVNYVRARVLATINNKDDLSIESLLEKSLNIVEASQEKLNSIKNSVYNFVTANNGDISLSQRKLAEALGWASSNY